MKKTELLRNPGYWTQDIQLDLYEAVNRYLKENKMTRTQFAEKLGVSKGYVSQVLNGDFDHKLSKLVELALACELVPVFTFIPLAQAEKAKHFHYFANSWWKPVEYTQYYDKQESVQLTQSIEIRDIDDIKSIA